MAGVYLPWQDMTSASPWDLTFPSHRMSSRASFRSISTSSSSWAAWTTPTGRGAPWWEGDESCETWVKLYIFEQMHIDAPVIHNHTLAKSFKCLLVKTMPVLVLFTILWLLWVPSGGLTWQWKTHHDQWVTHLNLVYNRQISLPEDTLLCFLQ